MSADTIPPRAQGVAVEFWFVFAMAAVLLASKAPDSIVNPQFWAEDGLVFFKEQFQGSGSLLFAKSSGYFQVLNRLVAWIAGGFPLAWVPAIYNFAALGIGAGAVAYLAWRLRDAIPLWITLPVFALVPTNGEIFGTMTNAQWLAQFCLVAACVAPSSSTGTRSIPLICLMVLLAGLSGPFSLLLAILVIPALIPGVRERFYRDGEVPLLRLPVVVTVGFAGVMQALGLYASALSETAKGSFVPPSLDKLPGYVGTTVQTHIFGEMLFLPGVFIFLLLALVSTIMFAPRVPKRERLIVLLLMGLGGAQAVLGSFNSTTDAALLPNFGFADRYFYVLKVSIWLGLALIAASARVSIRQSALVAVACLLTVSAIDHSGNLQRAPLQDYRWADHVKRLEQGSSEPIPINPAGWAIPIDPHRGNRSSEP